MNRLLQISIFLFTALQLSFTGVSAQTVEVLTKGNGVSLRGLSVVNDLVFWVSGSKGTVGRSVDGGKTFSWIQIPGYETRDFRDIEAFSNNTAVIVAIAEPAVILRTIDAGKSWTSVFTDSSKGVFIDAFNFTAKGGGAAIGDPLDGRAYLLNSSDYGKSWKRDMSAPLLDTGEACFASSGTNIIALRNGGYVFVTGGRSSRLFTGNQVTPLPLIQGGETTGANSVAIYGEQAVIVGGDFTKDTSRKDNCVLVTLGKKPVISKPITSTHGYRSCVEFITKSSLVACGTSGVDLSNDGGKNWQLVTREGFHVAQRAKNGKTVYLAGSNGKVAVLKN